MGKGAGADGGSMPTRWELVDMYKAGSGALGSARAVDAVDPAAATKMRWSTCALTQERLDEPVVACELGYLYNKEALLSAVLRKSLPPKYAHVKGLKDVVQLQLTARLRSEREGADDGVSRVGQDGFGGSNTEAFRWMCPLTNRMMGSGHSFVVLFETGVCVSKSALRECGGDNTCPVSGTPYEPELVVTLNAQEEEAELQAMRERMEARRAKKKATKAAKKAAKKEAGGGGGGASSKSAAPAETFLAAPDGFAGSKPGMLFKSGPQGTGYYLDDSAKQKKRAEKRSRHAAAAAAAPQKLKRSHTGGVGGSIQSEVARQVAANIAAQKSSSSFSGLFEAGETGTKLLSSDQQGGKDLAKALLQGGNARSAY